MKRILPATLCTIGLLSQFGCSGASEGNTSQAADEVRKEIPKPTHEALPVDEDAIVIGGKKADATATGGK